MLVAWMSEAGDLAHRITPSHEKSCYFILLFFLGSCCVSFGSYSWTPLYFILTQGCRLRQALSSSVFP